MSVKQIIVYITSARNVAWSIKYKGPSPVSECCEKGLTLFEKNMKKVIMLQLLPIFLVKLHNILTKLL